MTTSLHQAFAEAAKLSDPEQEVLASRLLAELAAEDDFDRAIVESSDKLASLAREAARRASGCENGTFGSGAAMNSLTTRRFRELLAALPGHVWFWIGSHAGYDKMLKLM